ncbi:MAG: nucleotide pyrophosphohydrolase [Acidiferrobacterales bacterium]|nr:nucleotide pyrophosphohydrolase [Acidiferrobacterales bacterium]
MNDIAAFSQRLREFAQARDWEQFHSPKNLAMALIVEAAELVEHFQWMKEDQTYTLSDVQRDEVALEMADIFIYLLRIAERLNIDLAEATNKKIAINDQRYPVEKSKGRAARPE